MLSATQFSEVCILIETFPLESKWLTVVLSLESELPFNAFSGPDPYPPPMLLSHLQEARWSFPNSVVGNNAGSRCSENNLFNESMSFPN